jgi:mono/diheme cytochrome c family protein
MPILKTSCVKCHGVEKVSRGLDLTTFEKMMNGSIKGPVVVPGNAEKSNLFSLAKQGKMPKQGQKLSEAQLEILRSWIDSGAPNN